MWKGTNGVAPLRVVFLPPFAVEVVDLVVVVLGFLAGGACGRRASQYES